MEKEAIVSTKYGKLRGAFQDGIYVFKGIPYAAPPVGEMRWHPPQPPERWHGVRPALEYGAIAPQNVMPVAAPGMPDYGTQKQSEDCLYLNIWTPGLDDGHRPVMVWIHGGAFIIGAGSESFLEGGKLAKRGDVVIVSINYRLGAFGFLNLKEITGGKIPATGNEGLLDQVAALEWVGENIAAFGGDPDNITVFGFSAGGMSIGCLLAMPKALGKFHKAINRSGAANIIGSLESAVRISEEFLMVFNLTGRDVDALRKLSTERLLEGQQVLGDRLREREYRVTPFQPVHDGVILPNLPMEAIRKGVAKGVSVMAGNTLDEMKAFSIMDPAMRSLDEEGLVKRLRNLLPPDKVEPLIRFYRAEVKRRGGEPTPAEIMGGINVAIMFRIPTINLVEAQRDNGTPAYNYLFTYKSPAFGGALGAMHGLDNPLLFGNPVAELTGVGLEVEALSQKIQDSCAAFARSGDPSCPSIGKWLPYGKERYTMILDRTCRLEAAPYDEERRIWEDIDLRIVRPM
ncbi:MAG: carboxylesterase/lipase family protein [Dehalococcoidales bacterium]|nr:carboxylesterase/lipase family protein [Dehalococcoidales bacterium]